MERSKFGAKRGVESSSASIQMVLDPSDAEFRPKGAGSLKAYSYSHPPPPSYRRVNPQKRAASPSAPDQPFYPLEVNYSSAQESEVRKSPDEPPSASPSEHDSASKPSFASFSEETRRRLLKLNLQKKAAEKRRQSEGEKELTPPPSERSDEAPRDAPRERKISDQGVFESMDQLSSSSTSRSSSAHSSKNPSLDSLHVAPQPQPDKVASLPVTSHSETPRVNGGAKTMSLPNEALREVVPRSNETVVAVVKGRGVVSGTLRQFEPARRPASLDIPTKRENAEELRLARRSLGSEESSDTSSDEGDECAISMSKTFDEKLRILLDLGSTFGNKEGGGDAHSDDDKSSVRSEPQRRPIANSDEMAQRRASDEPGRVYKIVGVNPSSDTLETVSTPYNTRTHVPREASRHETPETESRSNSSIEINASKYFAAPSTEERASSQPPSPARTAARGGTPVSSDKKVGDLRQRFESSPSKGKVSGLTPRSNQVRGRDYAPPVARKKIGSVRTTTPVSLKEFNVKPAGVKPSAAQPVQAGGVVRGVQRGTAQRPPESRAVSSRSIRLESSPAKHSSTSPVRYSTERTDSGVDRTTPRGRPNDKNERSKGPPVVGKTHVPPRVMNREYGTKSKLLSHKDSAKELLPSKTRVPARDVRGSQTQSKLEKDAQHIAELLEEMHSERYLHLSRQQSDISGQAQKAAAQRAAIRRRRRSLGDDNNPVTLQMVNSPADERENTSAPSGMEVTQGGYNTWRHEADVRPNSPQRGGNTTRSAVHTVKR